MCWVKELLQDWETRSFHPFPNQSFYNTGKRQEGGEEWEGVSCSPNWNKKDSKLHKGVCSKAV